MTGEFWNGNLTLLNQFNFTNLAFVSPNIQDFAQQNMDTAKDLPRKRAYLGHIKCMRTVSKLQWLQNILFSAFHQMIVRGVGCPTTVSFIQLAIMWLLLTPEYANDLWLDEKLFCAFWKIGSEGTADGNDSLLFNTSHAALLGKNVDIFQVTVFIARHAVPFYQRQGWIQNTPTLFWALFLLWSTKGRFKDKLGL